MRARRAWLAIGLTLAAVTATGTLTGGPAVAVSTSVYDGPRGVSCPTASVCLAVGGGDQFNRVSPTVYRRIANNWKASKLMLPTGVNATLDAISCPTATSCVAIGSADLDRGSGYTWGTLVARWNGTKWHTSTSPLPFASVFLYSTRVDCPVSTAMCWVVNGDGGPAVSLGVLTPSGLTQKTVALPAGWTNFHANDISCTPKACMLVGSVTPTAGGLDHGISYLLTGTTAGFLLTPQPVMISVECLSATSCVASASFQLLETWNGTQWTYVSLNNVGAASAAPRLVGCRTPSNCLAFGSQFGDPSNPDVAVTDLIRISGTSVTTTHVPGNLLYPNLFSGDCSPDRSTCAIVGTRTVVTSHGESVGGSLFLHYSRGHWTRDTQR
jgi:hypothetical protein